MKICNNLIPTSTSLHFEKKRVEHRRLHNRLCRRVQLLAEASGILELGNVWVFDQLIHRPMRTKNQLYKNPNIAVPAFTPFKSNTIRPRPSKNCINRLKIRNMSRLCTFCDGFISPTRDSFGINLSLTPILISKLGSHEMPQKSLFEPYSSQ